jgi:hypothetical protein
MINNLQQKAVVVEKKLELRKAHQITQIKVANNLMSKCDVFKNKNLLKTLQEEMSQNHYKTFLVKEKIISLDDLSFYEILLKSFKASDSEVSVKTNGYMVQNDVTNRCFGII